MARADGLVEPEPLRDVPAKKVYPPLQWWPLRVMNPWQKFAVLVAYVLGARILGWILTLVLPVPAQVIVFEILWDAALIAMARSFRGYGEPMVPKRAWWRLTARPRAGWWLALLWFVAFASQFTSPFSVTMTVHNVSSLILGLAFLNSSIRLTAQRRHPQI